MAEIRFDLYPTDLHPATEQVLPRDVKAGDFVWLSHCGTPTFQMVASVLRTSSRVMLLDHDNNSCGGGDVPVERLVVPIRLEPRRT